MANQLKKFQARYFLDESHHLYQLLTFHRQLRQFIPCDNANNLQGSRGEFQALALIKPLGLGQDPALAGTQT